MKIRPECLYKCNMGGVWKFNAFRKRISGQYCEMQLIGSWMDDVVYDRENQGNRSTIWIGFLLQIKPDCHSDNDKIFMIQEIEP